MRPGARSTRRFPRSQLEAFLASPVVPFLPVSLTTADRFGLIAAELRRQGAPLPSNDIWIAAHALETEADLIRFDRHFANIAGLSFIPMSSHDPLS